MKNINDKIHKIYVFTRMGENYLRYKAGHPAPFFGVYFATLECNYNCRFCPIAHDTHSERSEKAQELRQQSVLTTAQAKYAIDWLKKIGTVGVSFTGGEPLLRKDLEEIAFYARKKHFFTVLNTNASLVTEKRAHDLAECFDSITVSLSGSPEIDDMLRGAGAYEKTNAGIRVLKKATKLKISINFVITSKNHQEIDFIIDYAKKHCDSITFLPISYKSDFFLDRDSANIVKQKLISLKKQHGNFISNSMAHIEFFDTFLAGESVCFNCDPFDVYFALASNGEISGCCSYPYYVGNILSMSPGNYRFLVAKHKKKLLAQCGGCSSPICWELSALYRRPFFPNASMLTKYFDLLFNK